MFMLFAGLILKKVTSSITSIYNMIDRIWKQPIEVQRITLKNLPYNAFALLPENVLFSMVKFDEPEVREDGIKRILAIR